MEEEEEGAPPGAWAAAGPLPGCGGEVAPDCEKVLGALAVLSVRLWTRCISRTRGPGGGVCMSSRAGKREQRGRRFAGCEDGVCTRCAFLALSCRGDSGGAVKRGWRDWRPLGLVCFETSAGGNCGARRCASPELRMMGSVCFLWFDGVCLCFGCSACPAGRYCLSVPAHPLTSFCLKTRGVLEKSSAMQHVPVSLPIRL